ncbi:patatin-like phospholipase family protein [Lentzea sp. BCCO 10_0061]|uniref:Patatin-like phospholipase family protein n=1 Tax=Lentzea sokolovensis TaxID=3095429 RepID=A0ABU4VB69_9PSEU|nr:patatin-like phospholipase family protein [Lentzea sp. BCCO 10_0061]MDX8149050.1 patatin-like phospholipase family protein [Lentzea sp. BCCO 10_0061]
MTGERALVLGGGGVTGIAWETGILHGLAEQGVDLTDADLFVGTSAGSVVAAELAGGGVLADLYAGQLLPPDGEIPARLTSWMVVRYALSYVMPGSPARKRARLGRAAVKARTPSEESRLAVFDSRLSIKDWPERALKVTAVDVENGKFVAFDRDSGVPLVKAVASSCAVPLVWPPVSINGSRYMDGGMRSVANVDLAAGYERVVVIAPLTRSASPAATPGAQAAKLGVPSIVVSPDSAALAAIGSNLLDPAKRKPAAEAGYAQAVSIAAAVRKVWQ